MLLQTNKHYLLGAPGHYFTSPWSLALNHLAGRSTAVTCLPQELTCFSGGFLWLVQYIYIHIHCWNCFIYSTNYVMWILCPGAHLDSWFWIRRKSSGLGELWQVFLFVSSPQKNRGFTAKSLALAIVTQIFKIRNKLLNLMLLYYINKLMLVLLIHNTHRLKHLGNSNGLSSKKGFCHDLPPSPAGAVATAYLWMDEERKSQ